ncbi:Nucleotide-binding protein, UspA family [Halapricum desulfuricans]|uniref:Nucleotide-binding protein, UspA family n=1 Tax=Halapricum desulfuricans TaxID=2841257 RepID=A0A897NKC6_9EURY|nr:universal stress protein [Halapricum desulfuricans]QSG12884.1 Nucleotide-binding protein, UspA family [Halapricum desulfuricans]
MYDDILLPFDGSDGAAAALHHTAEIAHWADATIHVLFVADTTRDSVTVVETHVVDTLVEKGEEIVEDAAKTLRTLGADYETDVIQGNPAPMIAEYAEQYGHDLIAMPTHGRAGISRYVIGSITEKVVRLSDVPVLTMRMQPDEQLTFPYENVLVPTDGSARAVRAGEHGLSLAAALDATVHVLSVVEDDLLGLDVGSADAERQQAATDAVDDLVSAAEDRGVTDVVRHVERGTPDEVILETIEANDIHAVVMGTSGKRGTDRILLGSVAEKTARSAPVPVITVGQSE